MASKMWRLHQDICSLTFSSKVFVFFSILIATYDETSSLLFYRISKGLTPPHKPSNKDVMNKIPEWNEQQARWKY